MPEFTFPPLDGGLCLSDLPYKLQPNQSQNLLNMTFKDKVLNKRFGQSDAITNLNGPVHSIHEDTFNGYGVVHAGTNMYKWDITNSTCNSISNGIANTRGSFFAYDDDLYYMDGAKYWTINSGFAIAEVTPFIPIVYTGCTPNLSVTNVHQDYNIIGGGFETWYSADGSNLYTLPGTGTLSNTNCTAKINGTNKTEGSDFTVDRTNRKVTWSSAPTNDGVLNGVRIVAYDTLNTSISNQIKNCTLAIPFGGESSGVNGGTRIIVSGNSNFPTIYWRSGLKEPTYFPDSQFEKLDNNDQAISVFGKQYGDLIAFKKKSIYGIKYSFDGTNVTYPTRELHSRIGCDMRGSVQLIDNRLVFANTYQGGFILDRIDQTDEKNAKPISNNINGTAITSTSFANGAADTPGILYEALADLQKCVSMDFDRKYWLCIDDRVYMWDYDISPYYDTGNYAESQRRLSWFLFDTMPVGAFFANNNTLYYGRSDTGKITLTENTFKDYGGAISCHWESFANNFGLHQYLKTVSEVILGLRSDTNTLVTIEYFDEKKEKIDSKTITVGNFSYEIPKFSYSVFTYNLFRFAQQIRRKPKRKKILYLSVKLSNATAGRDLGITDLTLIWDQNRRVK